MHTQAKGEVHTQARGEVHTQAKGEVHADVVFVAAGSLAAGG